MRVLTPRRMRLLTASWPEEEPIEGRFVTGRIDSVQSKVAARNLEARLRAVEADSVKACHRRVYYRVRREVLEAAEASSLVGSAIDAFVNRLCDIHLPTRRPSASWDTAGLLQELAAVFGLEKAPSTLLAQTEDLRTAVAGRLARMCRNQATAKLAELGASTQFVREFLLRTMDDEWSRYLADMDIVIDQAGLRGWLTGDAFGWYWREGDRRFGALWPDIERRFLGTLLHTALVEKLPPTPLGAVSDPSRDGECDTGEDDSDGGN